MSLAPWRARLRIWIRPTIACAILGALIALAFGSQVQRLYRSEVSLYVGPQLDGPVDNADLVVGQTLRQTLADLATTRPVLTTVIAAAGVAIEPGELAGRIDVRVPGNSNILGIGVTDPSPDTAALLANELAVAVGKLVIPASTTETPSNVSVTVVEPAILSETPVGPSVQLMVLMGAAIGFIFALAVAFVVETLSAPEAARPTPTIVRRSGRPTS